MTKAEVIDEILQRKRNYRKAILKKHSKKDLHSLLRLLCAEDVEVLERDKFFDRFDDKRWHTPEHGFCVPWDSLEYWAAVYSWDGVRISGKHRIKQTHTPGADDLQTWVDKTAMPLVDTALCTHLDRASEKVLLYQDNSFVMAATPNRSCGYVYASAWQTNEIYRTQIAGR